MGGCSQAAYLLSSSFCLFSIPPLLLHSIHFIVFFFTGCQAPGPAPPMGTRTTPTDARAQSCGAAVPAKPRVPSVRVLSCVGDLRSGKQKLHVSTGWGGKATSLQASVAGPEGTERVSWAPGAVPHCLVQQPSVSTATLGLLVLRAPEQAVKAGLTSP